MQQRSLLSRSVRSAAAHHPFNSFRALLRHAFTPPCYRLSLLLAAIFNSHAFPGLAPQVFSFVPSPAGTPGGSFSDPRRPASYPAADPGRAPVPSPLGHQGRDQRRSMDALHASMTGLVLSRGAAGSTSAVAALEAERLELGARLEAASGRERSLREQLQMQADEIRCERTVLGVEHARSCVQDDDSSQRVVADGR